MLLVYADHYISPFEGSPRAGAAEYVQRGGCTQIFRQKKKSCKNFLYSKKSFYLCRKVIKLINV